MDIIDLYVKAIDLAKERSDLSNQERILLNRFKILLCSGSTEDADRELKQIGKVKKTTLHNIRESAESVFEDWVRHQDIGEGKRNQMLLGGKMRADVAEKFLFKNLKI